MKQINSVRPFSNTYPTGPTTARQTRLSGLARSLPHALNLFIVVIASGAATACSDDDSSKNSNGATATGGVGGMDAGGSDASAGGGTGGGVGGGGGFMEVGGTFGLPTINTCGQQACWQAAQLASAGGGGASILSCPPIAPAGRDMTPCPGQRIDPNTGERSCPIMDPPISYYTRADTCYACIRENCKSELELSGNVCPVVDDTGTLRAFYPRYDAVFACARRCFERETAADISTDSEAILVACGDGCQEQPPIGSGALGYADRDFFACVTGGPRPIPDETNRTDQFTEGEADADAGASAPNCLAECLPNWR